MDRTGATNLDSGDTLSYSITGGNDAGHLTYFEGSSELIVASSLDHERASSSTLTVRVQDRQGLADTAIV